MTVLDHEEVTALDVSRSEQAHARESQRRLSEELTRLIHGESGLAAARRATDVFFGAEIANLSDSDLLEIFADVPNSDFSFAVLDEGLPVVEALVATGLCKSKGEARRTIQEGGAYVNNRSEERR